MKYDKLSRRLFLQGAGSTLALPLLSSLAPRSAQAAGPIKRFIAMKTYNHPVVSHWYPTFQGNGYMLKNAKYTGDKADGTTLLNQPVEPGSKYRAAPLTDLVAAGRGVSTNLGPFLNRYLPKMLLLRGIDVLPDTNHNYSAFLGNYSSCDEATPVKPTLDLPKWPTIDQVMAYSPTFYANAPQARSLNLGTGIPKGIQWSDNGNRGGPVYQGTSIMNPLDAYNKAFEGFTPGNGAGSPDQARQLKDAGLIDRVYQDYVRLKNNRRLSGADKMLLEQYATLLQDLHNKLKSTQAATCTKPAAPPSSPNNTGQDRMDIKTKWELFIDVVVASIMCDRSRVFTLDVRKVLTDAAALYHNPDGVGGSWHGAAHRWGAPDQNAISQGHTWAAQHIFGRLMEKLDVVESGGATYLDNSLIYWGSELGFNHINYSIGSVLAGGAGGYLKTGRYIDYIDWDGRAYFGQHGGTVIKGIPHNQLCVTILQAMGVPPSEYERPGRKGFGETATTNKSPATWATDYDLSQIGNVLPGIRA
jgi:hypothetical protein